MVKNWRPTSLVNVDAKLASKTLAKRLEKVLPEVNHFSQNAFVYSLFFRTTLESKLREFQFKILNSIVFANEKLFRFGMADSPSCAFCQTEVESVEH